VPAEKVPESGGQANQEASAGAGGGVGPNLAAMIEDGPFRQGQPEAHSVALTGGRERFEQMRTHFAADAGAVVLHAHDNGVVRGFGRNAHVAAARQGVDRVGDQILENPLDGRPVEREFDLGRNIACQRDAGAGRGIGQRIARGENHIAQAARFAAAAVAAAGVGQFL